MDRIRIKGGATLNGVIPISGAKNAALPLMTAALLSDKKLILKNVPHLADITTLASLLAGLGVDICLSSLPGPHGHSEPVMELDASKVNSTVAPYELVRRMRASVLVLGPLLSRFGNAKVSLPGGCAIGTRPVDLHIKALEQLGAEIQLKEGYIEAKASKGLRGGKVIFPKISVGATENILMAAALAKGETVVSNAAREPEVVDLCHCLQVMGVEIDGVGTDTLRVIGQHSLRLAEHRVIPDRIETGTFAIAAAITGGNIELLGADLDALAAVFDVLQRCGVDYEKTAKGIRVSRLHHDLKGVDVMTEPYPGFPTDLQAQYMALMTRAHGAAMITETIFENRFMHVPELMRMGADITVHHASALVRGVHRLAGAPVMATDLRASVSLVLAALAADGETILNRVYHLDRGYERLEEKLQACGAVVERIREPQ